VLRECVLTASGRKANKPPGKAHGRPFLDFHILLDTKNGWKVPQPKKILSEAADFREPETMAV
jgi:hypothetical protein